VTFNFTRLGAPRCFLGHKGISSRDMLDDREQSPRRRGGRSREEEDDQEQRREEQMDIVSGRLRSRQSAMKTSRLSPNRWPAGDRSILVDDIDLVQL
jgi:hypothetical protein